MQTVIEIGKFIIENYQAIIAAIVALLSGIIAVAMLIPGEQPEKTLKTIVEFIAKFSKK